MGNKSQITCWLFALMPSSNVIVEIGRKNLLERGGGNEIIDRKGGGGHCH